MTDPLQFDPELKELLLRRTGDPMGGDMTETIAAEEVPVVVRLHDPSQPIEGLHTIARLGHIVTARVPIGQIVSLRKHANVASLKASLSYSAELSVSVADIHARPSQLASVLDMPDLSGAGVMLGVIDWWVDPAHKDLRHADGRSRLRYIWDQRGGASSSSPQPYGYGREFNQEQINSALDSKDPYSALDYDPASGDPRARGSHGTHVMSIAAGSGLAPGSSPGVAPGADLIFVHLKGDDTRPEDTLGDSVRLLEAVHYILERAGNQPVVINMSLGRTGDSKDGTSPVEQALDAILTERPGRAVCMSTGNYLDARLHSSGKLTTGDRARLRWEVYPRGDDIAELEIWYPGKDRFGLSLYDPYGHHVADAVLGESQVARENETILASIYHRERDPNNGDNQINVFLWPQAPTGTWTIELFGEAVERGDYDAWIERDKPRTQSRFHPDDADPYSTIGTLTCGHMTIPVGAYDARVPSRPMLSFSSAGPSRDGRQVPLITAPGARVQAAQSTAFDLLGRRFQNGQTFKSGTSMAAPHVSGVVALMMQASGDQPLSAAEIRDILVRTARPSSMPPERTGAGMVDAAAAVAAVRAQNRTPSIAAGDFELQGDMDMDHYTEKYNETANHIIPDDADIGEEDWKDTSAAFDDNYEVDIETDPILFHGQSIELRFPRPVNADSAQGGIRITPFVAGDVQLSKDARELRWSPRVALPPGHYQLDIGQIADQVGEGFFAERTINFSAEASSMRKLPIPDGHEVLHRSEGRLPVTRKRIQVVKAVQRSSGSVKQFAADHRGRRVDLNRLLRNERRAHIRKYKKLHPTLYDRLKNLSRNQTVPIAVWAYVDERFVDKQQYYRGRTGPLLVASRETAEQSDESSSAPGALLAYRRVIATAVNALARVMRERIGATVKNRMQIAPVIIGQATKMQIRGLARLREVSGIYYYDSDGILDLNTALSVSKAGSAISSLGFRGTDIRVGVWEPGPDNLSQLRIEEHFDSTRTEKSNHARLVTAVIKNRQSSGPKGFAPDAKIYSANKYTVEALEWAVRSKECTVINQSFHRRDEARKGDMSFDDKLKDYLATHYPFPSIVHAAGNYWAGDSDGVSPPSDEYVNHKGYNTLSVGNHNDTAAAMSGSSVFRNPPSSHGDRELPELCANGTNISAVGLNMSGTSFASPAVAGSVALLQNANNTLIRWPEVNRAILMASAKKNVAGSTWWRDVSNKNDTADGAGAMNTEEAVRIARNQQTRNNSGSQRGWALGTLYNSHVGSDRYVSYVFRVSVPSGGSRRKVKVALAWDSKSSHTSFTLFSATHHIYLSSLMVDLDLHIFDGTTRIAHSTSFENSYEVAEFSGTPGKTYTIKISRYRGNQPTYFGLAWTVHA
jgi:subtilisin family serine protease